MEQKNLKELVKATFNVTLFPSPADLRGNQDGAAYGSLFGANADKNFYLKIAGKEYISKAVSSRYKVFENKGYTLHISDDNIDSYAKGHIWYAPSSDTVKIFNGLAWEVLF